MKNFAISMVLKAIDEVSGPLKGIGGNVASFQNKIKTGVISVGNGVRETTDGLKSIGMRTVAVATGTVALAKSASAYGDDVNDMSRVLGMSTDSLQAFRYVGKMSGVEIDEMDTALKKFTVNLGKTAEGGGISKTALHALGLSAKELRSAGADKALDVIADKFAKVKDPAVRANLAVELFGKSGAGMVNVLSEGSAGIEKAKKRAKELGIILDKEAILAAADFDDKWQEVTLTLAAAKNMIGVALMPKIQACIEWITRTTVSVRAWSKANPELAKTLETVGLSLGAVALFITPVAKTITGIYDLSKAVSGLKKTIKKAGGIGEIFQKISMNPKLFIILAVIVAIGAAVYLIYKNWDKIVPAVQSGIADISRFFSSLWDGLKKGFFSVASVVLDLFGGIGKTVLGLGSKVAGAFGIDTSGLDAAIGGIEDLQSRVKNQSFFKPSDVPAAVPAAAVANAAPLPKNVTHALTAAPPLTQVLPMQVPRTAVGTAGRPMVATGSAARVQAPQVSRQINDSKVTVNFQNVPRGTRVTTEKQAPGLNLEMGYAGAAF